MNREPLVLPRNCANCAHFDGEGWCAMPRPALSPLTSFIGAPSMVVCIKHEPKAPEE